MSELLPLRVVQWTTGNIAQQTVRGVLARPDLDLVGVSAHSPSKVGRDVAELVRLLGASVNVVTTSELLTGRSLDPTDRVKVEEACVAVGATLFGTGMNPGWAQLLAGVAAGIGQGVRHVKVSESVDVSLFAGDADLPVPSANLGATT